MKRYRDRGKTGVAVESGDASTGKEKMWAAEQQLDAGMDELFAVLGYKVKSSDMAGVAEKLEQLEMAMGSPKEDGSSLLSSTDTVHYNPSDLSGWVESMLSELNNTTGSRISGESSGGNFIYDDDLRAIPGGAILSNSHNDAIDDSESGNKRVKSGPGSPPPPRPVVVVDSQEAGVRLVHTLMACAEAVQREDRKLADAFVQNVGVLAVSQAGAMRKVATYFAKALARKIYKIHPGDQRDSDALQTHFYETAPYLKFAHFTANQAILEAFAAATRVHVIDFSLKHGMQWPALMQALALRPGGPPAFRLTGIGSPQPDTTVALQQVGMKLAQLAEAIGLAFEFRVLVVDSLAEIEASTLDIRPTEAVAVNSVLELHRLLSRPGAMDKVLDSIKGINPNIVTIVEQEANHNGSVFLDRFNEALHYYSAMFDSLQSSGQMAEADGHDLEMTDVYLGQQICNVVACEGVERVERHEALAQWRRRMDSAGFGPVHLGSNAFREASMMLAIFGGGDGYEVEENEGCLTLGWHTRPLIATSAWRVRAAE